jgi:aerobic-type carbon monoxide dehydrogenase small subunit (CoxS/CutS family)
MEEQVRFTLNGKPVTLKMESDRKLLWVLRTELGLTGAKYGCGEPAIVIMGAMLANAVHDAVSARMFRLPMTLERIKAAAMKDLER